MEAASAVVEQGAIIVPIKTHSKVISLKLDEALLMLLDRLARQLGISRSELIRALIRALIYLAEIADIRDPNVVLSFQAKRDGKTYKVSINFGKTRT